MADESWHVTLFHIHPDGTATAWAWWVDQKYGADMLGYMGEPDAEGLLSAEDVQASIAHAARETWVDRSPVDG
jgi:hypothetical protein